MKTFKILFAFIATVVLFAACGPEEQDAPKVTFLKDGNTLTQIIEPEFIGGVYTVTATVNIDAPGKIKSTEINKYVDNSIVAAASGQEGTLGKLVNGDKNQTSFSHPLSDVINQADVWAEIKYEVVVTDKEGKEGKASFVVKRDKDADPTYAITFTSNVEGTEITIGSDTKTITSTTIGVVFDLKDGEYTFSATKTGYHMTAPDDGNFKVDGAAKSIAVTMATDDENLDAAKAFSWVKAGFAETEHEVAGIKFKKEYVKATFAGLTKSTATKFVDLTGKTLPTTKGELKKLIDETADMTNGYDGKLNSTNAVTNYTPNLVLGTINKDVYYLIIITKSEIGTTGGTTMTLTTTWQK